MYLDGGEKLVVEVRGVDLVEDVGGVGAVSHSRG